MQSTTLGLAAALVSTGPLLSAISGSALAATDSRSLNVSATVVASCTIAPQLTASPQAALAAGAAMCKPATGAGIVARRPQISVEHDAVLGMTLVVFEF